MRTTEHSQLRRSPNNGFTIVELLVVIAILVILAILGFGVAGSATRKANSMKCVANLRDWSVNFASTAADRNGRLPTPKNWAAISNQPYDPEADNPGRSPFADYWNEDLQESMRIQLDKRSCPCLDQRAGPTGNTAPTYMLNWRLSRAPQFLDVYLSDLDRPGSQILFIDGFHGAPLRLQSKSDIGRYMVPAAELHGGTVNAIFADLHVGQVNTGELESKWTRMITNTQ